MILVDYMMPQVTGLGVAEVLRKLPETKSIPIVCMTAYDLTSNRHNLRVALSFGISRYRPERWWSVWSR